MGRAKQQMMDNEYDNEVAEFLQKLLDRDELKGTIEGISRQVIDKGVDSMSEKQKFVFDNFVNDYKKKNECECCVNGNISSLSDYIEVAEEGKCPMCQYDEERLMED